MSKQARESNSESIRVYLSRDELSILDYWASRNASNAAEKKMAVKIARALVTVGGARSQPLDFGPGTPAGGNLLSTPSQVAPVSQRSYEQDQRIQEIAMKSVNDLPLTDEEQQFYFNMTGMTL